MDGARGLDRLCQGARRADGRRRRASLRAATLDRARAVAEATGGFLGLTSAVSDAERQVLATLESALA